MSFSIPTYGPGTPFFTGSFADPNVTPQGVSLNGVDYPIDLRKYRHNGLPRFRNGVVTSQEANDALLNPEAAWWRYRFSWHQGAGQNIDELDEDSLSARYEASRGVDVWTKYQACLLPDTETKNKSLTASNIWMVATATYVYVSDGSTVQRCADPELGASATWSSITGLSGTVQGMCTDGTNVYIATTSDVYVVSTTVAASTFSTAGTASYDECAVVANRLIVAKDNIIGELGTSTFTPIYTHFQAGFVWTSIFAVGSRIYFGGYSGNRSEIYTAITDSAGALVLSTEVAQLAYGELIYTALAYAGSVILGTSFGVRFCQVGEDGTLNYGPLIDDYGACYALSAEGRFVWAGIENFPDSGTGLVRLALDTFTDTLLPAYAPDIFTTASSDQVEAIARFGDSTLFAVTADEVYGENPGSYVTTGYIDSGDITFGTVEDKAISETRVQYDELAANESVAIALTDRQGTSIGSKTDSIDGSDELTLDVVGNNIDRARVRVTLTGDGTTTPCLKQWRMRAYPIAPGTEEWIVPLILHSRVRLDLGSVVSLDPWDATAEIRDIWQNQEIVLYKEGDYSYRVRIDNFQIDTAEWRDGADFFELTCTVRLLST